MPVHSRLTEMSLFNTCDVFFLDAPLLTGKGAKWRFFEHETTTAHLLRGNKKGVFPVTTTIEITPIYVVKTILKISNLWSQLSE